MVYFVYVILVSYMYLLCRYDFGVYMEISHGVNGKKGSLAGLLEEVTALPIVISDAAWSRCIELSGVGNTGKALEGSLRRLAKFLGLLYINLVNNPGAVRVAYGFDLGERGKDAVGVKAVISKDEVEVGVIMVMLTQESGVAGLT